MSWSESQGKWVAQISVDNRKISLGRFNDKAEAADAYRRAVLKYFGEFGRAE